MFFSLQNSYKYNYWENLHILLIYPKHNIQFLQSPIHHPVGISTPWLLMLLSAPVGPLLPAQWWNLWRKPNMLHLGRCWVPLRRKNPFGGLKSSRIPSNQSTVGWKKTKNSKTETKNSDGYMFMSFFARCQF